MVTDLEALKYNEALKLPKFKAALDRLLNRREFDFILTAHSVPAGQLAGFIEQVISEGNAVLIEREWNGYIVVVWKD